MLGLNAVGGGWRRQLALYGRPTKEITIGSRICKMNAASVFAAIALFFQVALAAEPVELTDDSFAAAMESGPHFVKFYAPW